jgi:hypothetical protein
MQINGETVAYDPRAVSVMELSCFLQNDPGKLGKKFSIEIKMSWFTVLGKNVFYIGELANLTTKIITLLEFFNFVSEVSRLQYE